MGIRRTLRSVRNRAFGAYSVASRKLHHPDPDRVKLNIGAGRWHRSGWHVLDFYSDGAWVDLVQDLRTNPRLPYDDNGVDVVFTSHTLEHLDDVTVDRLLADIRRVLRPGGTLRIGVPDGDRALDAYLAGDRVFFTDGGVDCIGDTMEQLLANFFASYSMNGHSGGPDVNVEETRAAVAELDFPRLVSWFVGQIPAEAPYKAHVNGFDRVKLLEVVKAAGFTEVAESTFRGSAVAELRGRMFDNRPDVTLFVEATG